MLKQVQHDVTLNLFQGLIQVELALGVAAARPNVPFRYGQASPDPR